MGKEEEREICKINFFYVWGEGGRVRLISCIRSGIRGNDRGWVSKMERGRNKGKNEVYTKGKRKRKERGRNWEIV